MPPHLYPPDPRFPGSGASAERAVWQALRDTLPDDAALFANLAILHDATEHEIDLLVAWPGVGLAVIETKGGHITRRDGAWYQGRPPQQHHIDPVRQAQDARHALQRWLRTNGAHDAARSRTAHLVAFPHTTIPADWHSPEAPRAIVLDRHDLADAATRLRDALEGHGGGHAPLTSTDADILVAVLAAPLPAHTDALARAERLAAEAAEHTDRIEQLTHDQSQLLAGMLRAQRRLVVVGAAGSGKTFVALETARRRAREGERVALLCYSRGLGRYLERTTATWPARERPAFVG
ncbi:MAG TPA: nuclease-related domain-containing protein, partial [Gemmatimonadaceae bacterium]|nr:nuclease-related domain-containing protein [Gemmatimonadaceae bacterium]